VYPTGDTRWNGHGAFLAYTQVMTNLGLEPLSINQVEMISQEEPGDLASKIDSTTIYIRGRVINRTFRCISNNDIPNIGNLIIFSNSNKNLPRCILFRDSFSTALLEFYAQSFSELFVVWQPNLDYSLIHEFKPDIVISQQAERFLVSCPDDINGKTNTQYVEVKIKIGTKLG
jgi:hypothetical protein